MTQMALIPARLPCNRKGLLSVIITIPSVQTLEALPVIRLNQPATSSALCTRLFLMCDDDRFGVTLATD
jgi:hypothetical protein